MCELIYFIFIYFIFRAQSVENLGLAVISLLTGIIVDDEGYYMMELLFCFLLTGEYYNTLYSSRYSDINNKYNLDIVSLICNLCNLIMTNFQKGQRTSHYLKNILMSNYSFKFTILDYMNVFN